MSTNAFEQAAEILEVRSLLSGNVVAAVSSTALTLTSDSGDNGGRFTPQSDVPADTADFNQAPAASAAADDDIPF